MRTVASRYNPSALNLQFATLFVGICEVLLALPTLITIRCEDSSIIYELLT